MIGLPTELVSAVVASPDDDAPRQACADWLDEAGRPDEAELVRLQVRLGSGGAIAYDELTELRARRARLEAATAAARLGPLWAECGRDGIVVTFSRGFADEVTVRGTLTRGLLAALAAYPTVSRIAHEEGGSELAPADVPLLAAIRSLRAATFRLASAGLDWAHLEPLASLPRLRELSVTHRGRKLVTPELWARWERFRPADPVGDARAAFGADAVAELPSGGLVARVSVQPENAALVAVLPRLGTLSLTGDAAPGEVARSGELRALHLAVRDWSAFRQAEWRGLAGLRELALDAAGGEWGDLLPRLAALPELRSLALPEDGPALDRLPPLPGLRVLATRRPAGAAELAGVGLPGLVEWRCRAERPARASIDWRRFPRLRVLDAGPGEVLARPAGGWGETPPAPVSREAAASLVLAADARRVALPGEGVSLSVPGWFAEVPPPDPSGARVRVLAMWREWGDAGDDFARSPPTLGVLERIDGLADALDELARPLPLGLGIGRPLAPPRDAPGRLRQLWFAAAGPLARVGVRQLWRRGGRAYRLCWEGGRDRAIPVQAVADFAGDSLECDA